MNGKKVRILLFLITAVLALLFLSAGISGLEVSKEWRLYELDAEDGNRQTGLLDDSILNRLPTIPDSVLQILYLSMIITMPMLLIFSLFSPQTRRALLNELKRMIPLAIWVVTIIYLLRRLQLDRNRSSASELAAIPEIPDWMANPSAFTAFLLGLILLSLVLGGGWFVWRRMRRSPLDQIAGEAEATIAQLRAGGNFENAIVECYARMCQILRRERRIERAEGMTAREFAHRLETLGLAGVYVQQLTRLFEAVRYGGQSFDAADEAAAVACLTAVAQVAGNRPPPESTHHRLVRQIGD